MNEREAPSPGVLIRDFLLFYAKLLIDGLKDLAVVQLGILAFCIDLILMLTIGRRRRSFFYTVLELSERFDLWLNLYKPASGAHGNAQGLFGESRAGDATFLGEVEELVRGGPEPVRRPAAGTAGPGFRPPGR